MEKEKRVVRLRVVTRSGLCVCVCVCVRACVVCVVMRMSTCNNDGNMTTMQQQ